MIISQVVSSFSFNCGSSTNLYIAICMKSEPFYPLTEGLAKAEIEVV